MKIGVLSDTHIHSLKAGQRLADFLLKGPFRDIEMVLHAGDHVIPDLDSCFDGLPYFGVCGNMDRCSPHLPQRRIVSIGPYRVGMVHGWGAPDGIEDRVLHCFRGDKTDVIILVTAISPVSVGRVDSAVEPRQCNGSTLSSIS